MNKIFLFACLSACLLFQSSCCTIAGAGLTTVEAVEKRSKVVQIVLLPVSALGMIVAIPSTFVCMMYSN